MATYFTDHMADLTAGRNRIGVSYATFSDMITSFNLSRMPDWENGPEPYIGYILMSRPSLNVLVGSNTVGVSNDNGSQNFSALKSNAMTAALVCDTYGQSMLKTLSAYNANPWMPIITNKAKNFNVNDFELKTVEKGNTFYGHVLKYGKHSEDHKISGTLSIDFRNDRYETIMKLMQLWASYIYLVSKTDLVIPTQSDQMNAILDYAGSIYYLVTRRDGRELVYWEKLVGVFPIKIPLSIYNYSDTMILEDNVSIEFSYGIRADPRDPSILMDINVLSGHAYSTIQNRMMTGTQYNRLPNEVSLIEYAERDANAHRAVTGARRNKLESINSEFMRRAEGSQFVVGDVFASRPFIRMRKSGNIIKYYLCWEA